MIKTRIVWTTQAKEDLKSIRAFIARDSPYIAANFIRRIRKHVERLAIFPESGWVVAEFSDRMVREIVFGSFRIIYRQRDKMVEILTVFHGPQFLGDAEFES